MDAHFLPKRFPDCDPPAVDAFPLSRIVPFAAFLGSGALGGSTPNLSATSFSATSRSFLFLAIFLSLSNSYALSFDPDRTCWDLAGGLDFDPEGPGVF